MKVELESNRQDLLTAAARRRSEIIEGCWPAFGRLVTRVAARTSNPCKAFWMTVETAIDPEEAERSGIAAVLVGHVLRVQATKTDRVLGTIGSTYRQ